MQIIPFSANTFARSIVWQCGYIPTDEAFSQGGYETRVSRLSRGCEGIIKDGLRKLFN